MAAQAVVKDAPSGQNPFETTIQILSGGEGYGKTAIATELIYQLKDSPKCIETSFFWITCGTMEELQENIEKTLSNDFGLQCFEREEAKTYFLTTLNDTNFVIVFDGANDASVLSILIDYIPNSKKGKVMITTRTSAEDSAGIFPSAHIIPITPWEGYKH